MSWLGDFRLGDTIDTKFTTRQISGAPFTLAGSPVVSAYPGNSTTELTAGITLTVDFDTRTGLNHLRVVATGGNGYATATDYQLVITTGTVNGVSVVGEVVGEFSIEHRSALMPGVAARTLGVDATGALTTVTTLTNLPAITAGWLTAAGIAAGALNGKGDWLLAGSYTAPINLSAAATASAVWQDATAGDFTVANSIGKSLFTGNFVPGAAGGHLVAGPNAGTTTFGALSVTGAFTISDGLLVFRTTADTPAVEFDGNGAGPGVLVVGGASAPAGVIFRSHVGSGGIGLQLLGDGFGAGLQAEGGNSGSGGNFIGGAVSGDGLQVFAPNVGAGLRASGAGGTDDIVGNRTGNLTGTVLTVTNLTNAATAGDLTAAMKASVQVAADAAVTANSSIVEIGADTDELVGFITVAPPTAAQIADKILGRNIAGGSDGGRTVSQAMYFVRNKWTNLAGTLTVYETDDTTISWTAVVATDAAAVPIVGNDPA